MVSVNRTELISAYPLAAVMHEVEGLQRPDMSSACLPALGASLVHHLCNPLVTLLNLVLHSRPGVAISGQHTAAADVKMPASRAAVTQPSRDLERRDGLLHTMRIWESALEWRSMQALQDASVLGCHPSARHCNPSGMSCTSSSLRRARYSSTCACSCSSLSMAF